MDIIELQGRLILLTKSNISFTDIGKVLNIGRASVSGRAERRTDLSKEELEKIEKHYKINLNNVYIIDDKETDEALKFFGEVHNSPTQELADIKRRLTALENK